MLHSTEVDLDQRLEGVRTVTCPAEIVEATRSTGKVLVDAKLVQYIDALVRQTRDWPQFYMGASPAGLALHPGRAGRWPRSAAGLCRAGRRAGAGLAARCGAG